MKVYISRNIPLPLLDYSGLILLGYGKKEEQEAALATGSPVLHTSMQAQHHNPLIYESLAKNGWTSVSFNVKNLSPSFQVGILLEAAPIPGAEGPPAPEADPKLLLPLLLLLPTPLPYLISSSAFSLNSGVFFLFDAIGLMFPKTIGIATSRSLVVEVDFLNQLPLPLIGTVTCKICETTKLRPLLTGFIEIDAVVVGEPTAGEWAIDFSFPFPFPFPL